MPCIFGDLMMKLAGTPEALATTIVCLIVVAAIAIWGICSIYNNKE